MVKNTLIFLALIFCAGLAIGIVELTFRLILGYDLPSWTPSQYLLAVFLIGFINVVGEVLWHPIGLVLVEADKATDPLWKRSLRVLALVLLGMLPIVAYIVWQLKS